MRERAPTCKRTGARDSTPASWRTTDAPAPARQARPLPPPGARGAPRPPGKLASGQDPPDGACRRLDYAAMATAWKGENPRLGTVGCVALDARGRLAAATSPGGTGQCYPGRRGDTPLIG